MKRKALVLLSGGLDSTLAAKILKEQGIEVLGITFKSYFFNPKSAPRMAAEIKIPWRVVDFSAEHLKMVKDPPHGRGSAMNPCIDCHTLMLKTVKKIMKKEKFDFVATGEVLGERPMSQNKTALGTVEKNSTIKGYLLRPLSARLLEPTIPEQKGWVKREELLAISGRSRHPQMALAKKYGIKNYPSPGGGCLLCEKEFGERLKKLFQVYPQCQGSDINLLKVGRHFWKEEAKIIVGRNEEENKKIKKLARAGDVLVEIENYPGPLTLIRNYGGRNKKEVLLEAEKITKRYATKAKKKKDVKFKVVDKKSQFAKKRNL
ncbi:MAG: tRNA 4-thiouridine(8) synthase ThiI [bacterium]